MLRSFSFLNSNIGFIKIFRNFQIFREFFFLGFEPPGLRRVSNFFVIEAKERKLKILRVKKKRIYWVISSNYPESHEITWRRQACRLLLWRWSLTWIFGVRSDKPRQRERRKGRGEEAGNPFGLSRAFSCSPIKLNLSKLATWWNSNPPPLLSHCDRPEIGKRWISLRFDIFFERIRNLEFSRKILYLRRED